MSKRHRRNRYGDGSLGRPVLRLDDGSSRGPQGLSFPTVMILPQKEIADEQGIARGIRLFCEKLGRPVVVYLKHDRWLSLRWSSRW